MEPASAEASHDGEHYIATLIALSIRVAYLDAMTNKYLALREIAAELRIYRELAR
jgi:hypothetical protein